MSALAARRAASASHTPKPTVESPAEAVVAPNKRTRNSSPPDQVAPNRSKRTKSLSVEASSHARKSKKAKSGKSIKSDSRYFVPPPLENADEPTSSTRKGKARAFSPSHPVGDPYESSDGESSVDLDPSRRDLEQPGSGIESRYPSPDAPGPSRPRTGNVVDIARSAFVVQEGVNVHPVSSEVIRAQLGARELRGVVISLRADESIYLSGVYCITPLIGQLEIFSTCLNTSSLKQPLRQYRVFAPTSHPIPAITASASSQLDFDHSIFRQSWDLPQTFLLPTAQDGRSVFALSELHSGVEGLAHGFVPGFSGILSCGRFAGLDGVTLEQGSSSSAHPYSPPTNWSLAQQTLSTLDDERRDTSPPVILVRGPKRCGKSTFARLALNTLLERHAEVAWLECDLGQSEFSPGGVVGLWSVKSRVLGPSFTHPQIPVKAQYLGEYTPLSCPDEYIAAVRKLLQYYRYEMPGIPLVINTQGWVKGLGEDLLREIELASEPTHIFTFEVDTTADEYNGPGWTSSPLVALAPLPSHGPQPHHQTLEPASVSPIQSRFTASDLRILSLMAYFHCTLPYSGPSIWDFETPLSEQPPWSVTLGIEGAIKNVYLIGEGSDGVLVEDLALALNGSIVGLLRVEPSPALYEAGRSPPDLETSSYIGMAVIRGIEVLSKGFQLQLLTPLPPEALGQINAIVKNGAMELPLCALLEGYSAADGRHADALPFVDFSGAEGVGLEKRRFRRNIMRKGM